MTHTVTKCTVIKLAGMSTESDNRADGSVFTFKWMHGRKGWYQNFTEVCYKDRRATHKIHFDTWV